MLSNPRRIGKIDVQVLYPETLILEEEKWELLKSIADNCPVMKSIHPEIEVNTVFRKETGSLVA